MSAGFETGGDLSQLRRQAARRPVLTAAEEVRLARRIERGDLTAKDEMIERNIRLVFALARPFAGRGVSYDDLVQEGIVGLIRAVEKFDYGRGLKFSTYAVWWIRRSLHVAVDGARTIRIPASAGQQRALIQRAEAELRHNGGSPVTDEAIAEKTGVGVRTVVALRGAAQVTASLDEAVGEDATPLGELIADAGAPNAFDETGERETQQQVWRMLGALPKKHREVIARRYGLLGKQVQGHDEIAAWLGVGEERSRQIEREALHWLRELGGGRESSALAG
jgi:RNA polymerase primary sigma factor